MYLKSLQTITSKLTIYFDESCPLCLAEIHFLRHHNQKKLLEFVSLQEMGADVAGMNCELAFKTIHARIGMHTIITGPEVFFEAYKRTNLRFINFVFSFALARFFYSKGYVFFAKYRHQISKRIGPMLLSYVRRKYQLPTNVKA